MPCMRGVSAIVPPGGDLASMHLGHAFCAALYSRQEMSDSVPAFVSNCHRGGLAGPRLSGRPAQLTLRGSKSGSNRTPFAESESVIPPSLCSGSDGHSSVN